MKPIDHEKYRLFVSNWMVVCFSWRMRKTSIILWNVS